MIEETLHMLADPAHWGFEIVSGGIMFAIGAVWHSVWQRGHDRDHHTDSDWHGQEQDAQAILLSYGPLDPEKRDRQARLSER